MAASAAMKRLTLVVREKVVFTVVALVDAVMVVLFWFIFLFDDRGGKKDRLFFVIF